MITKMCIRDSRKIETVTDAQSGMGVSPGRHTMTVAKRFNRKTL